MKTGHRTKVQTLLPIVIEKIEHMDGVCFVSFTNTIDVLVLPEDHSLIFNRELHLYEVWHETDVPLKEVQP